MHRVALLPLMVIATWLLSGCTVIGACVGAAVPVYETAKTASVGETVRLDTGTGKVAGEVVAANLETTTLATRGGRVDVERTAVKTLERRSGSYWLSWAAAGLLLDVACGYFLLHNGVYSGK